MTAESSAPPKKPRRQPHYKALYEAAQAEANLWHWWAKIGGALAVVTFLLGVGLGLVLG